MRRGRTRGQGFGGRVEKPIQFVIGGSTYEQLADWRDRLLTRIRSDDSSGLEAVDSDYKETQPQLRGLSKSLESELGSTSVGAML